MTIETPLLCYRIYTEKVSPYDVRLDAPGITAEYLVQSRFNAFTQFEVQGVWKDNAESALVFEILGPLDIQGKVLTVAKEIRKHCGQETVLVTTHHVNQFVLTGD